MNRLSFRRTALTLTGAVLFLAVVLVSGPANGQPAAGTGSQALAESGYQAPVGPHAVVRAAARFDTSAPLRETGPAAVQGACAGGSECKRAPEIPFWSRPIPDKVSDPGRAAQRDPVLQEASGPAQMPAPLVNFEGVGNVDGVLPPDTVGDIGPGHYVQMVNLSFAIFDRQGNLLYGPATNNTLWSGFGGPCETSNDGDPIVLYDHLADRWLMSQFALPYLPAGPFYQCIAVSQTGDPTGAWHRYEFLYNNSKINDYPKLAVWPDGYYMSANQFAANTYAWAGSGVVAFEREQMLAGQPARMIYFDLAAVDFDLFGLLPADLDGLMPPPAGAPNYFAAIDNDAWGFTQDQLEIWAFEANWSQPNASSFSRLQNLPTASFNSICDGTRSCIPQPNVSYSSYLDAIADRLMFRLQYRNFGSHQSMVTNHTVAGGNALAGVRWYELRNEGGGWAIAQQGTYAPDGDNRWMASAAMDAVGNIAVGYSVSSDTTYPSIRYAGRLAGDPANTLAQGETSLIEGNGSQLHYASRWGDYSSMSVDPLDDCTFWYTQEYYQVTGDAPWQTRVGAFKFPNCTTGPAGTLEGRVTDSATGEAVGGARVAAGYLTTRSDDDGFYRFEVFPVGNYTLTVTAYGYEDAVAPDVIISEGVSTTRNFALQALPRVTVEGVVRDGAGQGWPLYARIEISGYPFSPIFTNPETGRYSVDLVQRGAHTFTIAAESAGYNSVAFTPSLEQDETIDVELSIDAAACTAPGYGWDFAYFEDFEADNGNYRVVNVSNSSWAWGQPTSGPGAAHSGRNAWATNLAGDYNSNEHSYLVSPPIDLSAWRNRSLLLSWWQYLSTESGYDIASVEVSIDNGATYNRVYGWISGSVDTSWTRHEVLLGPEYAVSNLLIAFSFRSEGSVQRPGFYVDDIGIVPLDLQVAHFEDFEADNGDYRVVNVSNSTWAWGAPTTGPGSAYSGQNVWATNLSGNYANGEHSYLVSPSIDLRSYAGQVINLAWWQWLSTESCCDVAGAWISPDAGATWLQLYEGRGMPSNDWQRLTFPLPAAYATADFRISFSLRTDGSVTYPGYYVDDILVDTYAIPCTAQRGGLVTGNVLDGNQGQGLNDARIASDRGAMTFSRATPQDSGLADGYYSLFAPAGANTLIASAGGGYGDAAAVLDVAEGSLTRQDFSLAAGQLAFDPDALLVEVELGTSRVEALTIDNQGGLPATFRFREQDAGFSPLVAGRPAPYKRRTQASTDPVERMPDGQRKALSPDVWGNAAPKPGGSVYRAASATCDGQSYYLFGGDSDSAIVRQAWRYDARDDSWTQLAQMPEALMNFSAACIDGLIYLPGGYDGSVHSNDFLIYDTATDAWTRSTWPNPRTPMVAAWNGKLYAFGGNPGPSDETWMYDPVDGRWQGPLASMPTRSAYGAAVTVGDYIYIIGGASNGGAEDAVQRYDPAADAWDAGGPGLPGGRMSAAAAWYGDRLYVLGGGGEGGDLWDAYDTSLMLNVDDWPNGNWQFHAETMPVAVLAAGYACVDNRIFLGAGTDVFSTYNLNQYLDDGRLCHHEAADVPWLLVEPMSGTLPAATALPVAVFVDAGIAQITQPGDYKARLQVLQDTPYAVDPFPVTMRVAAPATYGKLTGTVTGLGYCDAAPEPLGDVDVRVTAGTGMSWTVTTNVSGTYQIWLDEAGSPYEVAVSPAGYEQGLFDDVIITGQVTTTANFDLRWLQPCLQASPAALEVRLGVGYSTTLAVDLANLGAVSTTFEIGEAESSVLAVDLDAPTPAGEIVEASPKALAGGDAGSMQAPANSGGPDSFGYVFMDSREARGPLYDWIEIAPPAGGAGTEITALTGSDDSYFWPVSLPFAFNFYGSDYTQMAVASNGTLYFQDAYLGYGNTIIPATNSYGVNTFLAHLWTDLYISPGAVYVLAEPDRVIVEFYNVSLLGSSSPGSWQIILFANGNILYQYQVPTEGRGIYATVGIQGNAATGLLYSYNSAALENELAICFAYPGQNTDCSQFSDVPWLDVQPVSGTIPADQTQPVMVTVDATQLPAEPAAYSAMIVIRSDDPVTPLLRIPLTLTTELVFPAISQVRTSNVRDTSFSISWLTDVPAIGGVRWGVDPGNLNRLAMDDRTQGLQATDGGGLFGPQVQTHHVTLRGLHPATTYYFDVISGLSADTNNDFHYERSTGPTLGLPASDTVYGQVFREDGAAPAAGSLVYLTVEDADGQGSPGRASLLSSLAGADGFWSANLGNARTAGLAGYFAYSQAGDQLILEARGGAAGSSCPAPLDTADDSPAPPIVLNDQPCADRGVLALVHGWNLTSLPVLPIAPVTAAGACQAILAQGGAVSEVDRWQQGAWDGHVCGVPVNDFSLELAAGYFMNSQSASTWLIDGEPVLEPVPLNLETGWNAVGLPHTNSYSAASLCAEIIDQGVDALEIVRWMAGGWEGHLCGLPFGDFPIETGQGYFVRSASAGVVTPARRDPAGQRTRLEPKAARDLPEAVPAEPAAIAGLRVSNLRDSALTLSWLTGEDATGFVRYGLDPAALDRIAFDVRGPAAVGRTHFAVLDGLAAQQTIYYEIVSGGGVADAGGRPFATTSGPALASPPTPYTVYGQAVLADGVTPAAGAIVHLRLSDGDGQGSPGSSLGLAALVDSAGYWQVNLGNARTGGGAAFVYSPAGDRVSLAAYAEDGTVALAAADTADLRPAPAINLGTRVRLYVPMLLTR